jgi:hypothetical protein
LARWREPATSEKPRQRVGNFLVLGECIGDLREQPQLFLNVFASAWAAALRLLPLELTSRLSGGSIASDLVPTLKRRPTMVSSNKRFHAP